MKFVPPTVNGHILLHLTSPKKDNHEVLVSLYSNGICLNPCNGNDALVWYKEKDIKVLTCSRCLKGNKGVRFTIFLLPQTALVGPDKEKEIPITFSLTMMPYRRKPIFIPY